MLPSVAVVIPTYNRLDFLQRAVASVRTQDWSYLEIIAVDDASTDGTADWLGAVAGIKVSTHTTNQGVSAARNTGIAAADAEWIAFLDSDDLWEPHKLRRQFEQLTIDKDCLVSHTAENWIRNGKPVAVSIKLGVRAGWVYPSCLPLCAISPSSVVMHRQVFDAVGLFDTALPACEDYDMWLRVCARYPVSFVDEALVIKHGGHADQLSRQHWGMDRFRIQALTQALRSGVLSEEYYSLTHAMLEEKIRVYCIGARKRGKLQEIDDYEAILSEFT